MPTDCTAHMTIWTPPHMAAREAQRAAQTGTDCTSLVDLRAKIAQGACKANSSALRSTGRHTHTHAHKCGLPAQLPASSTRKRHPVPDLYSCTAHRHMARAPGCARVSM